jgi:hypothetical protein
MRLSPEEFRKYQEERRLRFLAIARERLGGKCSHLGCEETENLDFDHIIPGSRVRKISEATNWSLNHFLAEVDKCQLLCKKHHSEKTKAAGEYAHGERHGNAKLTDAEVRIIQDSELSLRKLAVQFGVSKTTIRDAKLGNTWKHVD